MNNTATTFSINVESEHKPGWFYRGMVETGGHPQESGRLLAKYYSSPETAAALGKMCAFLTPIVHIPSNELLEYNGLLEHSDEENGEVIVENGSLVYNLLNIKKEKFTYVLKEDITDRQPNGNFEKDINIIRDEDKSEMIDYTYFFTLNEGHRYPPLRWHYLSTGTGEEGIVEAEFESNGEIARIQGLTRITENFLELT